MNINKKVILITGTSSGIGKYLGLKLSKKFYVVGISRRSKKIFNQNYFHYRLDINDFYKMQKVIKKILVKFKRIDILVNNAGTNISHGNIYFVSSDFIKETINTNLISTILLTREVLRNMIINKNGKIINIGSSVINLLPEGESIYAASKAGIISFSKVLSKEIRKFNISSNCVSPFIVDTEMIKKINTKKITKIIQTKNKKKNKLSEIYNIMMKIINNNKINGKNFCL
tara:strand:- start:4807 stop:5493 length:687 start_codon:yes stop_codon:yes gene_type:complete